MTTRRVSLLWLPAWAMLATAALAQTMAFAHREGPASAGTPANGVHQVAPRRESAGKTAADDWDGHLGAHGGR